MASKTKRPAPGAVNADRGKKPDSGSPPEPYRLTPEREAELTAEAIGLGDDLAYFPGKLARRVVWSSRIQLAAERDAGDLVQTPFPEDEGALTEAEIRAMRDKIEFLRVAQSRWRGVQTTQQRATASFEKNAAEAGAHKQALLRFFDLRFRSNPEGQKRLSDIRAGSGDADLVQDISDLLVLCEQNKVAVARAPRGEARSAARLSELSPLLSRLLADKALSLEAQRSRKLRDAAYTLVLNAERRLRAAAEYWYGGTDKLKDYAPFPASSSGGGDEEAEEDAPAEPPAAAAEIAAGPPPA
jgi:hypothetical protein